MHIAVNLGVQKIASYQSDNLLPEEIDHELNLAVTRFIKQRYNPTSNRLNKGFEQSQKRIDDLRALVVDSQISTYNHGVLADSLGKYVYTANKTNIYVDRVTLPLDYMFLIGVRGIINYSCDKVITSNISINYDTDPTTNTITKYIASIPMYPAAVSNPENYYITSIIYTYTDNNGSTPMFENSNNVTLPALHDLLINTANWNIGIPVLSEDTEYSSLGTTHQTPTENSNNLLVEISDYYYSNMSSITVNWSNGTTTQSLEISQESLKKIEITNRKFKEGGDKRISICKFAQHDDVLNMMLDPFNITDYRSPIYTIEENFIDIHTDNTFVVPEVIIKYIRTPKAMSIKSGIGCELSEHTHPEIVEMAIKSILEGVQDPRYQTQTLENLESE